MKRAMPSLQAIEGGRLREKKVLNQHSLQSLYDRWYHHGAKLWTLALETGWTRDELEREFVRIARAEGIAVGRKVAVLLTPPPCGRAA